MTTLYNLAVLRGTMRGERGRDYHVDSAVNRQGLKVDTMKLLLSEIVIRGVHSRDVSVESIVCYFGGVGRVLQWLRSL